MTFKLFIGIVTISTAISVCGVADADTEVYAVVIGHNAPPKSSILSTLKYADDDAVRYYRFFKRFSDNVYLLTLPDARTQSRYPNIAEFADLPTLANFERVMSAVQRKIEADKIRGKETVFYFAFSGHGVYDDNGIPYLVLQDSALTGQLLYDGIGRVDADFQHLFIDACYAEGVVGARGMFDGELDSRHVKLTGREVRDVVGKPRSADFPGLGVVLSSTEHQTTHEWSRIESGVFTHEILSGLSGPADINLDGRIEYSELVAFVSAANREVADDRGRISVVAKPPSRNRNVPIVDLRMLSDVAFVVGDPSPLGHFYIELQNGERYAEANLSDMSYMHVAVPKDQRAFISTDRGEAVLRAGANQIIELAGLIFKPAGHAERGSIEASFQTGLFTAEYGRRYYLGFIDSSGLLGVQFGAPRLTLEQERPMDVSSPSRNRKPLAVTSISISGASAILAVTFGTLALKAKREFDSTELQAPSLDAAERFQRYGIAFWVSAGLGTVTAVAGWLLWPKDGKKNPAEGIATHRLRLKGASLSLSF